QERLCTLAGPPGVGKTRLALEMLMRDARFADRAFCDLTDVVDADAILHALARAIRAPLETMSSRPETLRLLGAALASRGRFLLVMDNVDSANDATRSVVADLLVIAPQATIIVTSRRRLSLAIECLHM